MKSEIKKHDPYEYANFFPGPGYYDKSNIISSIKISFNDHSAN